MLTAPIDTDAPEPTPGGATISCSAGLSFPTNDAPNDYLWPTLRTPWRGPCSQMVQFCAVVVAEQTLSLRQIRMSDEACVRLRPGRFMAWVEAGSVPTDLACQRWSFPSQVGGRMLWFVAETKRLLLASRAAAMRSWVTGCRGRLRPASGQNGTYQGGAVFFWWQ